LYSLNRGDFVSILDRFLLIILALGGLCAGLFSILLGSGVFGPWSVTPFGDFSYYPTDIVAVVIGLVLLIVALRFFFYHLGAKRVDFVMLDGEHGNIRISFETIRQLANRTGKSVRGVHEFDTRVKETSNGVMLLVRLRVLPDIDLSAMASEVQGSVKTYVEHTTGVRVDRVVVHIHEVAGASVKGSKAWVD
jgi:uncharacterized alkaline shock family protein YloU